MTIGRCYKNAGDEIGYRRERSLRAFAISLAIVLGISMIMMMNNDEIYLLLS